MGDPRTLGDMTIEEARAMVGECRAIFGPEAAQQLEEKLGLVAYSEEAPN